MDYNHTILIVDDEVQVGKLLSAIIRKIPANAVYTSNGRDAIYKIEKRATPFSLVISDQRMPEMVGTKLLETVADISPYTVRFLTSGYSDINAVIDAVNKGKIHKYIQKPWQSDQLVDDFKAGLKQYELTVENEKLVQVAKRQNKKLFALNKELKKNTEKQMKLLAEIDNRLKQENEASGSCELPDEDELSALNMIKKQLNAHNISTVDDLERLNGLFEAVVMKLLLEFQEIGYRKGFEIDIN